MIHRVMYPILVLTILGLLYLLIPSVEDAIRMDDTQQMVIQDQRSAKDLLRFIQANTKCDTTPNQLAAKMGPGYDLLDRGPDAASPEIWHLDFHAKYRGGRLVEVGNELGTVHPCDEVRR